MFYCNEILCKKGKLGLIWIAANFDGTGSITLTKRDYFTINLMQICWDIMEPPRPFALRLSSVLLLGIARIFARQTHYLLVDLRHIWECIKKQNNNKSINLSPIKAKNRAGAVTLSDPFADPYAQFNAWLLSNTTDVLNSSISDFDFPSESEFYTITDSQTVDLKEITMEEEEFPTSPISVLDDDDDFGDVGQDFVQQDNINANSIAATYDDPEAVIQNSDPQNDSVLLYDEASGELRPLEEAPLIMSPGNFVLEELTSDHVLPMRCKKPNARPRNKTVFISDSKFSECLRNPNDLLQSKTTSHRTKAKQLFDTDSFTLTNKGTHQLVDVWKRNATIEPYEVFHNEVPREMDDGSESSVEVLRAQYSIESAYEESREGLSQLSHLTPVNDQSSSLFSIPGNYEFEITSTQSKSIPQQPVALGNLSPIMDVPEFDEIDMDVDNISLPSLDDLDLESDSSTTSIHSQQLHHAFREIVYQMDGRDDIEFSSILPQPCSRKTAAKRFSQLLALTSKQILCVSQDYAYGEIIVKRGPQF